MRKNPRKVRIEDSGSRSSNVNWPIALGEFVKKHICGHLIWRQPTSHGKVLLKKKRSTYKKGGTLNHQLEILLQRSSRTPFELQKGGTLNHQLKILLQRSSRTPFELAAPHRSICDLRLPRNTFCEKVNIMDLWKRVIKFGGVLSENTPCGRLRDNAAYGRVFNQRLSQSNHRKEPETNEDPLILSSSKLKDEQ